MDQGIANIDYVVNDKDRLSVKYYVQDNPTTNPFGAVGNLLGFGQQLNAGSQVATIDNTIILTPNLTWEHHAGFTRLRAYANTTQAFTPGSVGMNLLGSNTFPQIADRTCGPDHPGRSRVRPQRQLRQRRHVPESVGIRIHAELGEGPAHHRFWRPVGPHAAQYHQQQHQQRLPSSSPTSRALSKARSGAARPSKAAAGATTGPTPWALSSTTTTRSAAT